MTTASTDFQTMPARFTQAPVEDRPNMRLFGRDVTDIVKTPYAIYVFTKQTSRWDEAPIFTIPVIAGETAKVSYGIDTYPLHASLRAEARRFALEVLGESA